MDNSNIICSVETSKEPLVAYNDHFDSGKVRVYSDSNPSYQVFIPFGEILYFCQQIKDNQELVFPGIAAKMIIDEEDYEDSEPIDVILRFTFETDRFSHYYNFTITDADENFSTIYAEIHMESSDIHIFFITIQEHVKAYILSRYIK